jgi:hypothetical protein
MKVHEQVKTVLEFIQAADKFKEAISHVDEEDKQALLDIVKGHLSSVTLSSTPRNKETNDWISIREATILSGKHHSTVYLAATKAKSIRSKKKGHMVYVPRAEVIAKWGQRTS